MSKWISEFLPNKNGSYLVIFTVILDATNRVIQPRKRYKFNTDLGWINEYGNPIDMTNISEISWWDEFGIAENKKVIKLSFTKPQNREI